MYKNMQPPKVRRQRLLLAISANCRAGGIRRHRMEELAKKVRVYDKADSLEITWLFYACDVPTSTADRLFTWTREVASAPIPPRVPFFQPRPLLEKAA